MRLLRTEWWALCVFGFVSRLFGTTAHAKRKQKHKKSRQTWHAEIPPISPLSTKLPYNNRHSAFLSHIRQTRRQHACNSPAPRLEQIRDELLVRCSDSSSKRRYHEAPQCRKLSNTNRPLRNLGLRAYGFHFRGRA